MKRRSVSRKVVAFFPSHPAQIWLLSPIAEYVSKFADVIWIIRDKDCSLALADAMDLDHVLLTKASRGLMGNALEFARATLRAIWLSHKLSIDLWITKYGPGNIAACLTGGKSISFNDDDADVVPFIAWTGYPFAHAVLVTDVTRMGRFESKALRFPGYYELCYLHPNRFTPDPTVFQELGLVPEEPFAIVRLSSLQSHHDTGVRGVSEELLRSVIELADQKIRIFITSEKPLDEEFEKYRFPIPPERIHHALAFAEFVVGDSQTMTSEAAVLGTPAFRLNDFVGRISYIDDLEKRNLAFGFRPGQETELLRELERVLQMDDRKSVFQERRRRMLLETIDPVPWFGHITRMFAEDMQVAEIRRRASKHKEMDVWSG